MNDQTCLVFSSNSSLYGINTIYVEEIIPLPELIQTSDTSNSVAGAFNFRGNPCLVIELGLYHNNQKQDYQLSDSVVVIKWEQSRLGIIADKVYEVKALSFEETYDNLPGHLNHVQI
ncbi:MAG: chemotaxis protein CheW [Pleurocapsa sp. CRU_1_2]|nr:chemotaxis protein CheW [Pleurocapsa sp. CRU_1_2]